LHCKNGLRIALQKWIALQISPEGVEGRTNPFFPSTVGRNRQSSWKLRELAKGSILDPQGY
jgi:hypothetical protein